MAKNKVSEWSATPANNTDIGGIDINEGCAPSGINNAIREVMAQIKDMQSGLDSDNFTVGGNLSVTGTSTLTGNVTASGTLAVTGTSTLTGLATATAGVVGDIYASNGTSKVLENGTDGTNATFTGAVTGNVTGTSSKATNIVGGNNTTLLGSIPYQSNTDTTTLLSPNTTTTKRYLSQTGTGTNGAAPAWDTINQFTTGTAVNTTSGSTVLVSNTIPSWARKITVIFNNVSCSGTDQLLVQLGTSGSIITSGYTSNAAQIADTGTLVTTSSAGFVIMVDAASRAFTGTMSICFLSGTTWVSSHSGTVASNRMNAGGGSVDVGGTVAQLQLDWSSTGTFDSGSVNIMYE